MHNNRAVVASDLGCTESGAETWWRLCVREIDVLLRGLLVMDCLLAQIHSICKIRRRCGGDRVSAE